ncbi:alpha/beta hydrolase [Halomicroarcula sp. S1AR25-4]|uniref:alpha/beta fold hydrolase n=1 Tax=Haloarcula sp. S1AR25-4 TaxID=2950538 RepID=UPI00287469A9|nr:alpha/beta hydrolase [Halomicroarcula sp. S1AR25-4]MDS0276430.1 alpha/beta hydrolase [Halomicroarcula sp. S1AR25-4]
METVAHHGRTTAYRVSSGDGDGPVALYVHGSGATHRVWANQYAPSGPTRPAAALDLSGHGESDDIDSPPGPETLAAYAADVVAVARAVDADVLVGNSLGGAVAQWVTLETDWRPEALVLVGTGPTLPVFDGLRDWLETDFDRAVAFLHGRDRLFHDADEELAARSREEMRETGQAVTRRDFLTSHQFDVTGRLEEIGVPTLAVCGEHDTLTPRSYHERLASEIPAGEFAVIPDAAHLAMLEQPAVFNETVQDFLAARLSGGESGQSSQ